MAYNFQGIAPINHPFLGAAQNMPLPPGVMQPFVNPGLPPQPQVQNFLPPNAGQAPTGQFPLNPGVPPTGQFPINPATGGPVMTPPHVIAGQPGVPPVPGTPPTPMAPMPRADHNDFDRQGWHQAFQAWRQSMPDFKGSTFDQTAFQNWRDQRPDRQNY